MSQTLPEVFRQAENDFAARSYTRALRGYVAVVQGDPSFTRARYRIGDTLLNLGDRSRAKDVYKGLAWHYIKGGQPLLGLVMCKMVLALDPAYRDLLYILAELYCSESDPGVEIEAHALAALPADGPAPPLLDLEGPSLVDMAASLASNADKITTVPAQRPNIPLFSHLSEDAFMKVLGSLRLRRHTDGQRIIEEGETGDSFFILADGMVVVSRKLNGQDAVLARLRQGAVFGEMALVSNAPRAATVSAVGDVDLLELSRKDLEVHAGELESVTLALRKFTRGRFLANLAATSPLFRALEKDARRALIGKFRSRIVGPADIIIEQGEAGRGLFLILRGEYRVMRKQGVEELTVATLKGGDVFGEISMLMDTPTTARVMSTTAGEILFLPKEEFLGVLEQHPELRSKLAELSEQRLRANQASDGSGDLPITDDTKLMI